MAGVEDSDSRTSSVDVIQSKKSEDLIGYVIQNAILETNDCIPEYGDEFWKPVTKECFKEGDISTCHQDNDNVNLNRHKESDVSCDQSESETEYLKQCSLRKAISDDSLAFKRHENKVHEIPEEMVMPTSFSEMTSPEFKNRKNAQYCDDSAEFYTSSEDDGEIDNEEEGFDFFREYEMKVDMLEYCDMAVDESFEVLKQHVIDLIDISRIPSLQVFCEHSHTEGKEENDKLIPPDNPTLERDGATDKPSPQDDQPKNEPSPKEDQTKNEPSSQDDQTTDTPSPQDDQTTDTPLLQDDQTTDTPLPQDDQTTDTPSPHDDKTTDNPSTDHQVTDNPSASNDQPTVLGDQSAYTDLPETSNGGAPFTPTCTLQDKVNMVADTLCLLRNRFERFIAEVSEMIHLGALSVRHAQRVDQWGAEVQKTYQRIYTDHQKMKNYLEEREVEWAESRDQYQAEIVRQGQQINSILQNLHIQHDVVDTPRRHNDKQKTAEIVNSVLMKRRCQEEQAMTLDFSRQSKISELKFLVIQQQGYIHRLQLKNAELKSIIRDVLDTDLRSQEVQFPEVDHLENISDVLLCDRAAYAPNKSCDPDVAGRQVFNIGDTRRDDGPQFLTDTVYDPQKLSYICLDKLQSTAERMMSDHRHGPYNNTTPSENTSDNIHTLDIISKSSPMPVSCET